MAKQMTTRAYRGKASATGSCANFCANICRRVFFGNPQCFNDCIACGTKTGLTMLRGTVTGAGKRTRKNGSTAVDPSRRSPGKGKQQHRKHRRRHFHGDCGCGCGGNCKGTR